MKWSTVFHWNTYDEQMKKTLNFDVFDSEQQLYLRIFWLSRQLGITAFAVAKLSGSLGRTVQKEGKEAKRSARSH